MGIKISELPLGSADVNAVVPTTNAAGNATEKVKIGDIIDLVGNSPLEFPGSGTDNMQIDATGLTFPDGTIQTRAARLKGTYDYNATYKTGDYVFYSNMVYAAAQDSTNQYPSDGSSNAYWTLQPFKPWTDWNGSTTYNAGEYVFYQNSLWVATQGSYSQWPYHGSSYWTQVFSAKFRGDYDYNASYKIGDYVTYGGAMYVAAQDHVNQYPTVGASNSYWAIKPLRAWADYDYNKSYVAGDTVYYSGRLYVAAQSSQNQWPSWNGSNSYWTLQSFKPWTDYDSNISYNYGDYVYYQNALWVATQSVQNQTPYSGSSYWTQALSKSPYVSSPIWTGSYYTYAIYPADSGWANGQWSAVLGGYNCSANGNFSVVCGGSGNNNSNSNWWAPDYGDYSFIGGGSGNNSAGDYSVVCGGQSNSATGWHASVLCGFSNNTNGYSNSHIIGSYITADAYDTTYVNNLNIKGGWNGSGFSGGQITFPDGTVQKTAKPWADYDYNRSYVTGELVQYQGVIYSASQNNQYQTPYAGSTYWTVALGTYVKSTVWNPANSTNSYAIYPIESGSATGIWSVVSGGFSNTASGDYSSVLGGHDNNTNSNTNAHIIGSNITADAANATFVNALKIVDSGAGITFPDGTTQTTAAGEVAYAIGSSGSAQTLDLSDGTVQTCTMTDNCTFTMPTAVAGKSFTMFLTQGNSAYSATFTGAKWPGGSPPTISATTGAVDILTFISDGAYWYGTFVQNFS